MPDIVPRHIDRWLPSLADALAAEPATRHLADCRLAPLPNTGLAHDHVRLIGTDLLLRVPKQSQLALDAETNLTYQAACFRHAAPSGHTPRIEAVLPVTPELPMGALVVEAIDGRPLPLPGGLGLQARALAALHRLPVPPPPHRAPLIDQSHPLAATLAEVRAQAVHLPEAGLDPRSADRIAAQLEAADAFVARAAAGPVTLISFDAHPGNFLVEEPVGAAPRAVLVDLEKARYGHAGFDLAHATLYTSTTWDVATSAELTHDQIAEAYAAWLEALPPALAQGMRPLALESRRLMWLWSVTWCAKWRVLSTAEARQKAHGQSAEDWSADLSSDALIAHVADRVATYLSPGIVDHVVADWAGDHALTRLLG